MFRPGDRIGPYTLVRRIGRGNFGIVWLAERRTAIVNVQVALKLAVDEDINLEAVKQEAAIWVQASGHPNILPIIEADVYDEQVVIVSEYAPDGSLDSWLKRHEGKAPSIQLSMQIASGILAGLEHLHARRIIHRDLKPPNILLQGETPRLADFGIARVLRSTAQSAIVAGTPAYMAPEAFDGKRNEQTDVWSAGVILYELVAGALPFPQGDMPSLIGAITRNDPDPLPAFVPGPLQEVIARSLQRNTGRRYDSATEMRVALRDAKKYIVGASNAPTVVVRTNVAGSPSRQPAKEQKGTITSEPKPQKAALSEALNAAPLEFAPTKATLFQRPWKARAVGVAIGMAILVGAAHFLDRASNPTSSSTKEAANNPTNTKPPAGSGSGALTLRALEFDTVTVNSMGVVRDRRKGQARYFTEDLGPGVSLEMVEVPGGTFLMGSPDGEAGRNSSEGPQHSVTVHAFYMGKYEVTREQWRAVARLPKVSRDLASDPSSAKSILSLPVELVSWEDSVEFCERLSGATGRKYRLPTEAEWEYACRAGTKTPFAFGETITPEFVNYDGHQPYGNAAEGEYRERTVPVGSLGVANRFGLYDMHGNVWEWCQDWYGPYQSEPAADPQGPSQGRDRVLRGGSWYGNNGSDCRSARRRSNEPTKRNISIGFRVVVVSRTQ